MFVVVDPMRDSLAHRLCTDGRWDGFTSPRSTATTFLVEDLVTRLYGKPVPLAPGRAALAPGGRYFAEDN